jgi:hypothetical protein
MKKKFLQKIANAIFNQTKAYMDDPYLFKFWLNAGKKLDRWCVSRKIYLD